ncbi:MAG TPA: hypothetical protein P5277_02545 [Candidatus Paceibacterota bacterium]|nr:hypothetical protein [Candidatus Paceibacterota bacterium]
MNIKSNMNPRCPKCGIELSDKSVKNKDYIQLDLICCSGNCPIDEINKTNGCKLCGADYSEIRKVEILDNL